MASRKLTVAGFFAAGICIFAAGIGIGQESRPASGAGPQGGEEMMMAKPSPEHARLKEGAGTWDIDMEMSMAPGQPPMKCKGTERAWLVGDFWLVTEFESSMEGMAMRGSALLGWDPDSKKYVGSWVDSMSPYLMHYSGTWDEATQSMTTIGEGKDPSGQMTMKMKMVDKRVHADTHTWQMFMINPDGSETCSMTMHYHRRK